jgi:hypothetical protein
MLVNGGRPGNDGVGRTITAKWPRQGKVYVAPVHYVSPEDIRSAVKIGGSAGTKQASQHAMRLLLLKRAGFSFENEIRLCFFPAKGAATLETVVATEVPTNGIERMLIDPYLPEWQAKVWISLIKTFGLRCPVTQSVFDRAPAPT